MLYSYKNILYYLQSCLCYERLSTRSVAKIVMLGTEAEVASHRHSCPEPFSALRSLTSCSVSLIGRICGGVIGGNKVVGANTPCELVSFRLVCEGLDIGDLVVEVKILDVPLVLTKEVALMLSEDCSEAFLKIPLFSAIFRKVFPDSLIDLDLDGSLKSTFTSPNFLLSPSCGWNSSFSES